MKRGKISFVYRKKLTDGHWRNKFDTESKQENSLIDTAAHELGHEFLPGEGHNCNAPNEATQDTDVNGVTYKRRPGNGTLVNGRPGLMAFGDKVLPDEHIADLREFTDDEKSVI